MFRLKYLLLPIAGGLSAFFSFLFAAPYISSLTRHGLKADDPLNQTTFGTMWGNVQHAAFGILLCGSFCFILEAGRRSWLKVLQATILGMILGGIANSIADSGADFIGLSAQRTMGSMGSLVGVACWFILVPFALAMSVTVAIGPTKQRIARAFYATMVAAIYTFFGRIAGMIVAFGMAMSTMNVGQVLSGSSTSSLEKGVPGFLVEAIFTGVALGLTMARADKHSRAGSLRLVFGRKEHKDWSLDHPVNRIGSSEVEIPVRGFQGVEPVHACVFRQGDQFILDSQHFPGFVNGMPVSQALLNHGDTIQLGEAQLVFYAKGAVRSQSVRMPVQAQMQPQMPPWQPPLSQMPPKPGIGFPEPNIVQPNGPVGATPASVAVTNNYALIDLAGKEYPLQNGPNTIGRDVGNTLSFPTNSTISRSHAVIVVEDDNVVMTDVGSANGSGLNGQRLIGPVTLKDGDTVAIGSATFTFRISSR